MSRSHEVSIDGNRFMAPRGELLLDAALNSGIDLPYDCRAGHCGACCVRLVSGVVQGGAGSEPGVVHACQCRIVGDVVVEKRAQSALRTVEGELVSLRALSREATEVQILPSSPFPYHAGQYAQVRFAGFPSRPFSITQPLLVKPAGSSLYFHIRRMRGGRVTPALGGRIRPGHRVSVSGPFGAAHFRGSSGSRLVLVGTSTGFAPIWAIATAALRENPERMIMVIAGGRDAGSLYMWPALARLARFPNVYVVPVCSSPVVTSPLLRQGRPTDFLPRLLPTDEVFACGAPGMVEAVKAIADHYGAVCHADPFLPPPAEPVGEGVLTRAKGWLSETTLGKRRIAAASDQRPRQLPSRAFQAVEVGVRSHFQS